MINITQKYLCCGCGACVQACPKHCIRLEEDWEGFLYPQVDMDQCIDCGKCELVCPELHPGDVRKPIQVYAAVNPDEKVRAHSSSGGIFTLLAESVIAKNGVVFGARFDELWNVIHDYTESKEGLAAFRGSKYVQSYIGETFKQTEHFLKAGRRVMFTGTSCQIMGLKRYLRKEYENLLAVDFVCHGVPSAKVWRAYLNEICSSVKGGENTVQSHSKPQISESEKLFKIKSIDFRNKDLGWKKYSFAFTLSETTADGEKIQFCSHIFTKNPYMQVFLSDLSLRPSCYNCLAKAGKSGSDITIGDFWGIEKIDPSMDDDRGTSLVILNTPKGKGFFNNLHLYCKEKSYTIALCGNRSIEKSAVEPYFRNLFMFMCCCCGFNTSYNTMCFGKFLYKIVRSVFCSTDKL